MWYLCLCVLNTCSPRIKMGPLIPFVLLTYDTQALTSCNCTACTNTNFCTDQPLLVNLRINISTKMKPSFIAGQKCGVYFSSMCTLKVLSLEFNFALRYAQFCIAICNLEFVYNSLCYTAVLFHVIAKMCIHLFTVHVAQMFPWRHLQSGTSLIQFFYR